MQSFGSTLKSTIDYAVQNPFGLDFEMHNKKPFISLGSALNCLGYNDYLEKVIGIFRLAMGALSLAIIATSKNSTEKKQEALISVIHCGRGVMEMMGDFELQLLIIDSLATAYNIALKVNSSLKKNAEELKPL